MVKFVDVNKIYNNDIKVVNSLNLEIEKGELVSIIGPSGCGKTTTLKMINRLIEPTSGNILIDNINTQELNPVKLRQDIGYVIQDIALFPHLTVASNISIVPKLKKWDKELIDKKVEELLNLVNMDYDFYKNRYPRELSGGQQQRIGVLRALAAEPQVMLMDEPFGALDPITREQLQDELRSLQRKVNKTIIFVTHDMDEALKISDRIVIMKDGEIVQVDTPEDILRAPANEFVRNFIGEERLIRQPDKVMAKEVMLKRPVAAKYNMGLRQGLDIMRKASVDSLLVTDYTDVFLGVAEVNDIQMNLNNSNTLEEIMKSWATVKEEDSVKDVVRLMVENNFRFIPVISEEGKLKGIVTRSKVVNFILDYM